MGGLRKSLPFVYICFLVGGGALAALPFVTAGFFSKDEILWSAWANGHPELFAAGLAGAFLTSLYTARLILLVFHGKTQCDAHAGHGIAHTLPLAALLLLSTTVGGLIPLPLDQVFPAATDVVANNLSKHGVELVSGSVALVGILAGITLWSGERRLVTALANSTVGRYLAQVAYNAWGFDCLYNLFIVRPFLALARLLGRDVIDLMVYAMLRPVQWGNLALSRLQTGSVRWYASMTVAGAVLLLLLMVVL